MEFEEVKEGKIISPCTDSGEENLVYTGPYNRWTRVGNLKPLGSASPQLPFPLQRRVGRIVCWQASGMIWPNGRCVLGVVVPWWDGAELDVSFG